jgi:heat shock protein HtpX
MKRIFLFVLTNLAVLALLALAVCVAERVFGISLGQGGLVELLVLAALCGMGGSVISLALSKFTAKRMLNVRVINNAQSELETWLLGSVERLAGAAGVAMPEVGIFEAEEMNAFATGARRNAALVAVSTGLLRSMPRPQVEAVLAHEISHVANGDMVTLALLQGVLNTFVIFFARLIGSVVDRTLFENEQGESGIGFLLTTMVAQLALGLVASLIVSWYSRQREFRADRGGANLAGVGSMLGALEALKRSHGVPLPPTMRAFAINSENTGTFMRLFMSHPPLDERIAALLSPDLQELK